MAKWRGKWKCVNKDFPDLRNGSGIECVVAHNRNEAERKIKDVASRDLCGSTMCTEHVTVTELRELT